MSRLEDVNARLRRTDIKGKPYVDVAQRILGFWELFPADGERVGAIVTELLEDDGERCMVKASVYVDGVLRSTGHAFEYRGAGMVNKTSYIENAETSAIGRALGVLGIGSTDSLASADELINALEHQEEQADQKPKDDPLKDAQRRLWAAETRFCELNGIADPKEWHKNTVMRREDYANTVEALDAIRADLEAVMP